jgi:hypothetical protein
VASVTVASSLSTAAGKVAAGVGVERYCFKGSYLLLFLQGNL